MTDENESNVPGDLRTGHVTLYTYLCVGADMARNDGMFLITHARHGYFNLCSSGLGSGGQYLLWGSG